MYEEKQLIFSSDEDDVVFIQFASASLRSGRIISLAEAIIAQNGDWALIVQLNVCIALDTSWKGIFVYLWI